MPTGAVGPPAAHGRTGAHAFRIMAPVPRFVVEASLVWSSDGSSHADRTYVGHVDLDAPTLPPRLRSAISATPIGGRASVHCAPGELLPARDPALCRRVLRSQFRGPCVHGRTLEPRAGRYYPIALLAGAERGASLTGGAQEGGRRPFRCLDVDATHLAIDLNHPLAGTAVEVEMLRVEPPGVGRHAVTGLHAAARDDDLVATLTARGPGMQAELPGRRTDFLADDPFARVDAGDDAAFYASPRLVHHLDAAARARVQTLYARLVHPGMAVLDLMASWVSHLPEARPGLRVTGLGLNADELAANTALAERVVRDLNRTPALPFPDASFDAAVCTASVEYLTRPVEVMREVARVLRPGAPFALTWSDRWFPPKVVRIWTELHPFERLALVIDLLRESGCYERPVSESLRGLPRPPDDKYAATMRVSDPVYAVRALRRG